MAETTITGLPNATTPLAGTERVPMDQAGATKDATTQDIANLAPATDLTFTAATRTLASSTGADVVLPVATTTDAGLESAADKAKLDSITVDSATLVRKLVRNNSGASIPKGSAVYQTGSSGIVITVALADASTEATASQTLGLTQETIANNANGYVVAVGELTGVNTSTLTEGQVVWVSETAGGLTTTRPTQPAHGVVCGYCVKQGSGTSGILYVKVDNGLELYELHDVLISSPTTGQVLRRASDGLWKNAVLATADISGLGTAATTAATDYAPAAQGVTNGNSHNHDGGDGAQIAYSSLSGLPTLPTGTNTGDQTLANTSNATSHTVTLSASGGSLQLVEGTNITLTTTGTGSAGVVTIDAAGAGGGSAPAPGYQTFANSALVGPMNAGGTLSSNNAVVQLVVYHPIYIPATQTFTQILSRTGAGYVGTTDIYLGIYSHDSTLNRPSSKIYDSGLLQITASGSANYGPGAISQSLSPGFYWLAFLASAVGTTPAFLGSPASNRGVGFPWYTEFSTAGVMVTNLTQASQTTLPATASPIQGAANIRPIVFLGV